MMTTYHETQDGKNITDGVSVIPKTHPKYNTIVDSGAEILPYQGAELSSTEIRDAKLAALTHDFGKGRIIQCRPHPYPDNSNMRNAIEQMERRGEESRGWYAADNTWITVTSKELKEAIESGQDQSDVVWSQFAEDVTS